MKRTKKRNNILGLVLILFVFVSITIFRVKAESFTDVSTEMELISAINANENIALVNDINLTREIHIPASYNGIIKPSSGNATVSINSSMNSLENMFTLEGKLKAENIIFNGNANSRAFRIYGQGSRLDLENVTIENCISTISGDVSRQNSNGGAISALGGARLDIKSSVFRNNKAVDDLVAGRAGQGGAIYANDSVIIDIEDTLFEENSSGTGNIGAGGGAIYADDNVTLNVRNSTFNKNHCGNVNDRYGNQGGAIQARRNSVVNSENNTYIVAKPFNTGGAIYLYSSTANINNDTFTIADQGDAYGISGGAIASEDSTLNIDNSNFSVNNSKVIHAGGIIDIVGQGSFNLRNSSLVGSGSWWRGPSISTYGGAICFESGSTATAIIENTTIRDVVADENGGAISLATKKGEESSVNLRLINTVITNTRTNGPWAENVGGGIYVAKGSTLSIEGGRIQDTFAGSGGGIYNDGNVNITGGTIFNNNTTYQIGGAIYNDGNLVVDNSSFTNNRNAEGRNYPGKNEMVGASIYANKDITITPNARFDDRDIRVLDKQSAIILTGALNSKINVSISETPIGNESDFYYEKANRQVGYTVAKSDGNYRVSDSDATYLHYVSLDRTQAISDYEDNTSIAKWDYVRNIDENTVVLGQRVKVIYYANLGVASFDINGNKVDKREKLYTIYSSETPYIYPSNVNMLSESELPSAKGYELVNWYNHNIDGSIDAKPISLEEVEENSSEHVFDFSNIDFIGSGSAIRNIIERNTFHVYAGWRRLEYEIPPVEPSDPIDPIDPSRVIPPGIPGEPIDPIDPPRVVVPVEPIDPIDPPRVVVPVEPSDPVDPPRVVVPVEPSDPVDPPRVVVPVEPSDPVDPPRVVVPVEPSDPVDPPRVVVPVEPIDPPRVVVPATPSNPIHSQIEEKKEDTTVEESNNGNREEKTSTPDKGRDEELITNSPNANGGNSRNGNSSVVIRNNISTLGAKEEKPGAGANVIVEETKQEEKEENTKDAVIISKPIISKIPKTGDALNLRFWILSLGFTLVTAFGLQKIKR